MLLSQDRSRHEVSHLFAVLYCLKCSPKSNFRLAVTDISAYQAVHDLVALHIAFGIIDGDELIFRLLKREQFLEFLLPFSILTECKSLRILTHRIQCDELFGDVLDGAPDPRAGLFPLRPVQAVEPRRAVFPSAGIFLQDIKLCGQHVEVAVLIFQFDIVFQDIVDFDLLDAAVNSDAAVFMHDDIADMQLVKACDLLTRIAGALFPLLRLGAEDVRLGDDGELDHRIFKAAACSSVNDRDLPRCELKIQVFGVKCRHLRFLKVLRKAPCPRVGG